MTQIRFLGTSAAEGVPAPFCACPGCAAARAEGGRALRSRQSLLIDDILLIDLGPDSFARALWRGLDLGAVRHILQTHSHRDHFCVEELANMQAPQALGREDVVLSLHGSAVALAAAEAKLGRALAAGTLQLERLRYGEASAIGPYRVLPLAARHSADEDCHLFVIEAGQHAIFTGYDTEPWSEASWDGLAAWGGRFDLVVLECTMVDGDRNWPPYFSGEPFGGHMDLGDIAAIRRRMLDMGLADGRTSFVATHFAHMFDPRPSRIEPIFAAEGFDCAYDGMTVVLGEAVAGPALGGAG